MQRKAAFFYDFQAHFFMSRFSSSNWSNKIWHMITWFPFDMLSAFQKTLKLKMQHLPKIEKKSIKPLKSRPPAVHQAWPRPLSHGEGPCFPHLSNHHLFRSHPWPRELKKNARLVGKNVAMFIHFHATSRWLPSFLMGGSKMIEVQVARLLKAV